jgi:hypothetical protein
MTRSRLTWMAVLVLVGCAHHGVGAIDYRLTDPAGAVKASARIEPDGVMTRLTLEGERDVTTLDPSALAELRRKVEDAQLSTLAPVYPCTGCPEHLTHTISVQVEGTTYTIRASDMANVPDRLGPLIDALAQACHVGVPWD